VCVCVAGSQYVVVYRMSVKVNRDQILNLPAYLTFSNATQVYTSVPRCACWDVCVCVSVCVCVCVCDDLDLVDHVNVVLFLENNMMNLINCISE